MTRRDEAAPLTVKGVADCELGIAAITVCGKSGVTETFE